ncbi:MAG TPA: hypothetical protein VHR18_10345 [Solirubrobacterales bacterium]|jgi:hypothetical protein|nr:hypothetical protein [Solirubrobacterales bacterium]
MGMFKDMRDLNKAGKQMKKERGGSLKMMKDGLAQANQMVQGVQADQELAERLANDGVDGTATIISMVATGATINMQPQLQFQMSVDVGGNVSTVTHVQAVSPAIIGQLQPGAQVPVKVDPNDHSQLMIGLAG